MLSRSPTSDAHSVHVILVYCDVRVELVGIEGVGGGELVADDPSADPGVSYSGGIKKDGGTPGGGDSTPTGPDWTLDEPEIPGTGLGRIAHVQIGDSQPTAGVYEPVRHVAVDSLNAPSTTKPVVPRRSTGVISQYILTVEGRVGLRTP